MSLILSSTGLIGEGHTVPLAAFLYGVNLAMASAAFTLGVREAARSRSATREHVKHRQQLKRRDLTTVTVYVIGAGLAVVSVYLAYAVYAILPLTYFIPEKQLASL